MYLETCTYVVFSQQCLAHESFHPQVAANLSPHQNSDVSRIYLKKRHHKYTISNSALFMRDAKVELTCVGRRCKKKGLDSEYLILTHAISNFTPPIF